MPHTEVGAGSLDLLNSFCTFSFFSLIVIKIEAKYKFYTLYPFLCVVSSEIEASMYSKKKFMY